MSTDPQDLKARCCAAYETDAVALVLGESYHPGGLELTRTLARTLGLRRGQRVLDVAAGPGSTARLLAAEFGVDVEGLDMAEDTVRRADAVTAEAGLGERVRFCRGDAEAMTVPDASFDALVCECAFCTLPDKAAAAAEFARVLRPGGTLGITDVTVAECGLPPELTTMAAWVACIADARPVTDDTGSGYLDILHRAGLTVRTVEHHDSALARMIEQIVARVRLLRMSAPERLNDAGIDVEAVLSYAAAAQRGVADGVLGYSLIAAHKPA